MITLENFGHLKVLKSKKYLLVMKTNLDIYIGGKAL